jgi:5-methylthioadenosine/S-adenosylhomocysteine deaminase
MNLLIKNVRLQDRLVHITVKNGIIEEVSREVTPRRNETLEIIDGKNNPVLPMLHNGHTHSPMVLLRGYGDDMFLDEWLSTRIWPVESRLTEEDYYWGNRLALIEMIKSGTGFFNEMYMNPRSLMDALNDYPLKAIVNFPIIDGMNEEAAKNQIEDCKSFFNTQSFDNLVKPGLALHSVYANSLYSLKWVRDFARENQMPIHIHLSETEKEVEECRATHNGMSPIEYLDSINFFTENKVFGAHCVWLDNRDMEIMADHNVIAVHNPVSNMKLASGQAFPYQSLKKKNIPMVLGTDGAASNNNLDLFEEMKIAALLQKHHFRDPTRLPAREAFSLAAGKSASFFETGTGRIEKGAPADFIILETNTPSMVPETDLISNIVYSASGRDVTHLICGGNLLMNDREVAGEKEVRQQASLCASRLTGENK